MQGMEEARTSIAGDRSFVLLRNRLQSLGYLKKEARPVIIQMLTFIALMLLGTAGVAFGGLWLGAASFLLLLCSTLGLATTTHTASHQAASHKRWVNSSLTHLGYPFFLGLSAGFWHRRHLQLHHAHPNVVGIDEDIEQRPVLLLVKDHLEAVSRWGQLWYRVSRFLLPVLVLGNGPSMQLSSLTWAARQLSPKRLRWTSVADALALLGHYVLWVGLPMLYFEAWQVIVFNLAWSAGTGYLLYCTFVPAHLPEEAIFIAPSVGGDYVMKQTATTINFRAGKLHSFLLGGLQYQIEHHLFPGASHNQLAAISEHVEAFCKAHGYPYRTLSYWEALWKATLCFFQPKEIQALPKL